jgi:hypothetical protein
MHRFILVGRRCRTNIAALHHSNCPLRFEWVLSLAIRIQVRLLLLLLLLLWWLWSDSPPTLDIAGAITPPLARAVTVGLVLVAAGAVALFAAGAVTIGLVLVAGAWAGGSRVRFGSLQTGSLGLGLLHHLLLLLELQVVLVACLLVAVEGFGADV